MEKTVINVDGMSCEHCVSAVKGAVGGLAGVSTVDVDLTGKTVTVEYSGVSLDDIKAAIDEQGFDVL